MTIPTLLPDDPALQAWIDCRLDPERAADIEAQLAANPALQAYAHEARRQNARLAQAFDALLDEPIPDRLRQAALGIAEHAGAATRSEASPAGGPPPAPGKPGPVGRGRGAANRTRWQMAAAVILAVAVGFAAGWGSRDRLT